MRPCVLVREVLCRRELIGRLVMQSIRPGDNRLLTERFAFLEQPVNLLDRRFGCRGVRVIGMPGRPLGEEVLKDVRRSSGIVSTSRANAGVNTLSAPCLSM
jgi:hypothetical protein